VKVKMSKFKRKRQQDKSQHRNLEKELIIINENPKTSLSLMALYFDPGSDDVS
jgi:hypothetical protein